MLRAVTLLVLWFGLLYIACTASERHDLMENPDPYYCYGDRRYDAIRDEEPDCAPDVVREAKGNMPDNFVPPAWWCVVPKEDQAPQCANRG